MDRFGYVWKHLDTFGYVWIHLDMFGYNWICLDTFGYVIPNGCFNAYEVKVNKDICKYQEKVKLISQFQRIIFHFSMAY